MSEVMLQVPVSPQAHKDPMKLTKSQLDTSVPPKEKIRELRCVYYNLELQRHHPRERII